MFESHPESICTKSAEPIILAGSAEPSMDRELFYSAVPLEVDVMEDAFSHLILST